MLTAVSTVLPKYALLLFVPLSECYMTSKSPGASVKLPFDSPHMNTLGVFRTCGFVKRFDFIYINVQVRITKLKLYTQVLRKMVPPWYFYHRDEIEPWGAVSADNLLAANAFSSTTNKTLLHVSTALACKKPAIFKCPSSANPSTLTSHVQGACTCRLCNPSNYIQSTDSSAHPLSTDVVHMDRYVSFVRAPNAWSTVKLPITSTYKLSRLASMLTSEKFA